MSKLPFIFVGSIVAAVIITIVITGLLQENNEPNPLGATPDGTFHWPRDVAVNSTGHIFVVDTQNSRGQIFSPDGTFAKVFSFPGNSPIDGSLNQPYGITINGSGYLYIADTFTNVIKIFNHTGEYEKTIGTAGTTNGTFYYPSGIAINATNVYYIADTYNNRLQVFNSTTNEFIQTIPP